MKHRIEDDAKLAMKSGDKARLAVLRLMLSEIKRIEIDSRQPLDDDGVVDVLGKMAKQRRESIKQFADAGRVDLQEKESFELEVITGYMPQPLSEVELHALIDQAIAHIGATSIKDMSKVMAEIKTQARGSVDLSIASRIVKTKLMSV
ncbi:MAG: GatB/YqeY domain-containing protein [Chromatiales bacterium]|nr:GatB/YqeY domain-containing protein [Chromatiales bacterium]